MTDEDTSTTKEVILAGLAPLFEEARRTGKWFHCVYQDMWFSHSELAAFHAEGRFIWGATNWTITDPAEQIAYLERRIEAAKKVLESFKARVAEEFKQ